MIGIYGHPNDEDKWKTWDPIKSLNRDAPDVSWLYFGDFNEILAYEDKLGGPFKHPNVLDGYQRAVNACDFRDLGFTGHPYTWTKQQNERW